MKQIITKRIPINSGDKGMFSCKYQPIDSNNWNYHSDIKASFDIKYDDDNIYIVFLVQELNTKAVHTTINDPVYEDSCVEFFISFDNSNYYNLEFNCIGNVLGGYGAVKTDRTAISAELLKNIKTNPSLGYNKIDIQNRLTDWTLEIAIPKEVFLHNKIETFSGLRASGNFYKCGDKQMFPHFLSWSPIVWDEPNFHLPKFFGELIFE